MTPTVTAEHIAELKEAVAPGIKQQGVGSEIFEFTLGYLLGRLQLEPLC